MSEEYDTLRLGCGTDTVADHWNVDVTACDGVDECWDLDETPWPWADDSWQHIVANHVFEHLESIEAALHECARVLVPGGTCTVRLPMGRDAYADATHRWGERGLPWTWRTPEFFAGERHWHADLGLRVADREVDVWSVHPLPWIRSLQQRYWSLKLTRHGPGEWCFDLAPMCGEFTVVFEKS